MAGIFGRKFLVLTQKTLQPSCLFKSEVTSFLFCSSSPSLVLDTPNRRGAMGKEAKNGRRMATAIQQYNRWRPHSSPPAVLLLVE
jgi:hypothetical protein